MGKSHNLWVCLSGRSILYVWNPETLLLSTLPPFIKGKPIQLYQIYFHGMYFKISLKTNIAYPWSRGNIYFQCQTHYTQASISLPLIKIHHHVLIILCKRLWHSGITIDARKNDNLLSPLSQCMSYTRAPGYKAVRAQIQPAPFLTPYTWNTKSAQRFQKNFVDQDSLRSNTTKRIDSFQPVGLQQSTRLKELNGWVFPSL